MTLSEAANPPDLIIDARWVIPVQPLNTVLERHSLVVKNGTILDILPTSEVSAKYHGASEQVRLDTHVLIPGLINLHTHAAMTLMRGLADDLPLMTWLNDHIWPAESRHVSSDFVYDGTLIACAEMLRSGTTCFNDMYFFPEAAAEAAKTAGIRASIGMIVIEFPTAYGKDADDYLRRGFAMRDAFKDDPLFHACIAPHAPYTVSDKTFEKILTYAEQLELPIHIHVHETQDEIQQSLQQYQMRPLQRLQNLGLVGPGLIAVHSVHLTDEEIDILAAHGCHVAHCPASNLKLGSGISPVAKLVSRGVNVGIGTDGTASNNRLGMLEEMRLAALLAKGASGDPTAVSAHQALAMATINAAKALGLDQKIGSLEQGKAADVVAVDLSSLETSPCYDPASHLVYVAGREHVSHVWVNGEARVRDGHFLMEKHELHAKAAYWQDIIGRKS